MADTIPAAQSGAAPANETPGAGASVADAASVASLAVRSSRVTWVDLLRALLDDKVVLVAVCFIILVVGSAILADFVAPYDPNTRALALIRKPPMTPSAVPGGLPYLLGTD